MKDNCGDPITVWNDNSFGFGVVYLDCYEDELGTATTMELSPKKARKLADKLYRAANKAEGICPKELHQKQLEENLASDVALIMEKHAADELLRFDQASGKVDVPGYTQKQSTVCPCQKPYGTI